MEQKKIEHITLHLMIFGTIIIIGVLARQTALHYGWDEFSSYLVLVVCSIIVGAIYFNLQMAFTQILSPAIEKCFLRFECYRSKIVVVEECPEPMIEVETTSDKSEEVSPHLLLKNLTSHQNMRHFVPVQWLRRNVHRKKNLIRFSHIRNEPWFPILMKKASIAYANMSQNTIYPNPCPKSNR